MKVVSFYSFKGGTGRTTTTANVAVDLARRGKNVVIVDLDIDGPGLDVVLGVKDEVALYIQDYLKEPSSQNFEGILYDLKSEEQFSKLKGALYFIPANLDVQAPFDATTDTIHAVISDLVNKLKEKPETIDYCLIDSQSGYTDLSATVLDISDHLFILSKFSRQHIIGTVLYNHLLEHLKRKKNLQLDFDLVMSVVPETTNAKERRLREDYLAFILKNTERKVLVEIPDCASLKWQEQVIIGKQGNNFRPAEKAFRVISEQCIQIN